MNRKALDKIESSRNATTKNWTVTVSRKLMSGLIEYRMLGDYPHTCEGNPSGVCYACFPNAKSIVFEPGENNEHKENMEFAALAHEMVPDMIQEIRRLQKTLSRISKMNDENKYLQKHWTLADAADLASRVVDEETEVEAEAIDRFDFVR